MADQHPLIDPVSAHHRGSFLEQCQSGSGLARDLAPQPDHGEHSYRGSGRLTGRRALVTGADCGVGRAVAIALAREGADVTLAYLPSEQTGGEQVAALVRAAGRTAVLAPTNFTHEPDARALVHTALEGLGGLDLLVLAAGVGEVVDDLVDLTPEQFDDTFKTNVYALFWITQEALPHLPPGSSIITTSSIQAYSPSPSLVDYAATKTAINTFSKALAQQVAARGIRVNVVAPGPFWTPLQTAGGVPTEALLHLGADIPLGRVAQPVEVAPAYVFLASAESGYVTGETLHVNGGMWSP